MFRYLSLYANFLRFSFSGAMQFRLNFYFRIFMDVVYYFVNIAFFKIIYNHTNILGGWNESQVMVFVGIYLVVDAVYMSLFSNNMWYIPLMINKGEIDYYLVRPVSSLFFLSLRDFAANSFVNLIMAIGILAWALWSYPEPIHFGRYLLLVVLIINGTFLYYLSYMLFIIPVFWTQSPTGMRVLWFSLARFLERPDRMFTGFTRLLLVTILPFGVMASFPARIFLEGVDWLLLAHTALVTIVFFSLVATLWRLGLRNYSSASS